MIGSSGGVTDEPTVGRHNSNWLTFGVRLTAHEATAIVPG
jgi:hypothetical protein